MNLDLTMLLYILMLVSSTVGLACGVYLYRMGNPKHHRRRFKLKETPEIIVVHAETAEAKSEKASPSAQGLEDMGDKLKAFMEEKK